LFCRDILESIYISPKTREMKRMVKPHVKTSST
jgi:hypothetical protein